MKSKKLLLVVLIICTMVLTACSVETTRATNTEENSSYETGNITVDIDNIDDIPSYDGDSYVVVNSNVPYFSDDEMSSVSFEEYSSLDSLGRCGEAVASIGVDIMPTEDRKSISNIYPTGWEQEYYDIVSGGYLYNRSHLIGFQLTGENDNSLNLITGTRHMNEEMITFENMVADYVEETENHVYYRVTPIFEDDNLVASGVLMEAKSVEDNGEDICFNVFIYNVQPGIEIDYATGESSLENTTDEATGEESTYILNTSSKKIHLLTCSAISTMNDENKKEVTDSIDNLEAQGYDPCGLCNP